MKTDPSTGVKATGAGRPRDPRIDAAILEATADLLVEIGYSNVTMAAVAERAGTTKTALYRRWSSKAELVHEAAFPATPTVMQSPPGDIAADLRAMIETTREVFLSPVVRAALPGLISDMSANAELTGRIGARFTDLFAAVRARLHDAVERGEVREGVDPDRLVSLVGGATLLALLQTPGALESPSWVDTTTDILLHGVAT
ncbi:TetR/AcrR family transcriptional regulator [Mycolicibacterium parafortuitum]|uniref:Putative transcriptional regulatory protein (Probably TetR-family) [Mycobacterium tuberculosis H37Rv] n=1 Tax=Mycolicibacterium parafortuitum TaxID=39692 RepID=A0A375YIC9_MYCPF|nr:TetR/AcrR family transcriptional regulator [Mycolicibacterium parafortuitum]ORB32190.1 TetR family transcriptional regulator [Mycolicibacterium parafortuitum]SRX80868.1 putative transcriptional regulatory protein (probably TetR-family) [Mycobacterium tuberculosis H37Rv] [Mycolicibacterium parafortuitum]